MKVLKNKVLVKEIKEEKTKSGLVIAPAARDNSKPIEASIEACGDECKYVKVGDYILYSPRIGMSFERDGETYRTFSEEDILAIL